MPDLQDNKGTQVLTCLCSLCELYPGDYEDTGNGFHVVYCEDGKTRYVRDDSVCEAYQAKCIVIPCEVVQ